MGVVFARSDREGPTIAHALLAATLLAAAGIVTAATLNGAARPDAQVSLPPLVIDSMYGRDLYTFYCASCHGRDGRGNGPAAPALRVTPPDLTGLAIRNGGVFPRARVEAIVTGRADPALSAHGSREMPVWGPIFDGLDRHEAVNRVRIANIVDYLASLQMRQAAPGAVEVE